MVDADRVVAIDARIIAVATVCLGWLIVMSAVAIVYVLRGTGDLWDPLAWGALPGGIGAVLLPFKGGQAKPAQDGPESENAGRHRWVPNGSVT